MDTFTMELIGISEELQGNKCTYVIATLKDSDLLKATKALKGYKRGSARKQAKMIASVEGDTSCVCIDNDNAEMDKKNALKYKYIQSMMNKSVECSYNSYETDEGETKASLNIIFNG